MMVWLELGYEESLEINFDAKFVSIFPNIYKLFPPIPAQDIMPWNVVVRFDKVTKYMIR